MTLLFIELKQEIISHNKIQTTLFTLQILPSIYLDNIKVALWVRHDLDDCEESKMSIHCIS